MLLVSKKSTISFTSWLNLSSEAEEGIIFSNQIYDYLQSHTHTPALIHSV